jgi:hypothetical protein
MMPSISRGNPFIRVALNAPAITVGYAVIAYVFVTIGCTPPFSEVDFFGVRVTLFLLTALTVAALILIVFAYLNTLRVLRVLRRRYRESGERRGSLQLGVAAVVLALTAFGATSWMAWIFWRALC